MVYAGDILFEGALEKGQVEQVVDLKRILPLGEMSLSGLTAEHSLDGVEYSALAPGDCQGVSARYVRIRALPGTAGGRARLTAGKGFVAEPEPYWTQALRREEAGRVWRGSDGLYSLVTQMSPDASRRKVLFTFGDTLISGITKDGRREEPLEMVNNSYAVLTGEDAGRKGALRFHIRQDKDGKFGSLLVPAEGAFDYQSEGLMAKDTYYWMQDWALYGDTLLTWPMLLTDNPDAPEGYKFRLLGTAMAQVPLRDGEPDFDQCRQLPVNLHHKEEGREILYGGGVLRQRGETVTDGLIHLYGYITTPEGRFLCLSRVRAREAGNRAAWSFFDGRDFVPDIKQSAPLLGHVSTELSVTLMEDGPEKGKYLCVFQYDTNSPYVAVSVADSPQGPFSPARRVYRCPESGAVPGEYTYNAKAHTPLSLPGSVIASYNVNNVHWEGHLADALLYRPRFIRLRHTAYTAWDQLFGDAFDQRRRLFDCLNQAAQPGGLVFAGDSLIQEFPLEEMLRPLIVYNRGIGGDTVPGLLSRLKESVLDLRPKKAFLLIGTNDLGIGTPPEQIAQGIRHLVHTIREQLPGCQVLVISLLPVSARHHPRIEPLAVSCRNKADIRSVNTLLKQGADREGYRFIDAFTDLADSEGNLQLHYTREGLHLSPEGYGKLAETLRPFLA